MDQEVTVRDIELSKKRTSAVCRTVASVLTLLAFILMVPLALIPIALYGSLISEIPVSLAGSPFALFILVAQCLVLGFSLLLLRSVFMDIALKNPFAAVQSRRLFLIALLMLLEILIELVPYPSVSLSLNLEYLTLAINLFKPQPSPINLSTLICSTTFLALSAVFRYGDLLQRVTDDTV